MDQLPRSLAGSALILPTNASQEKLPSDPKEISRRRSGGWHPPELIDEDQGGRPVALGFGHLVAVKQHPPVAVDRLRQLQSAAIRMMGPDDSMEADDLLAN